MKNWKIKYIDDIYISGQLLLRKVILKMIFVENYMPRLYMIL